MKKMLMILVAVMLSGVVLSACAPSATPAQDAAVPEVEVIEETQMIETESEEVEMSDASIKEFTVEGSNMKFAPTTLTVSEGDTVRITFKNVEGFHDFVIDEFDVATKQFQAPGEEVVEFVADQSGSFEYYCSVGQHRQMGMVGTLVVEPAN